MRKRIAVARYEENTSWLEPAASLGVDVVIYDKSDRSITDPKESRAISHSHIMLPNIGREAHTYLHHIVNNYHSLYDIEIFTQGNVSDHVLDFWSKVMESEQHPYLDFPHTEKITCLNEASYERANNENPRHDSWDRGSGAYVFFADPNHLKLYTMANGQLPDIDTCYRKFRCHAVFSVTREAIQRIPLSTYQKMLEIFTEQDARTASNWAYEFEYSWKLIFAGPFGA